MPVHRCGRCGFVAIFPSRLRRHETRCHRRPQIANPYSCINFGCGYSSNRQANVRRHLEVCPFHPTQLEDYCSRCQFYVSNLEDHIRDNHRSPSSSPYVPFKIAFDGKVTILRRDYNESLNMTKNFDIILKKELTQELDRLLMRAPCYQVQVTLKGALVKPGEESTPLKDRLADNLISHSASSFHQCVRGTNTQELSHTLIDSAVSSLEKFLSLGSGFSCTNILVSDLHAVMVSPLVVGAGDAMVESKLRTFS